MYACKCIAYSETWSFSDEIIYENFENWWVGEQKDMNSIHTSQVSGDSIENIHVIALPLIVQYIERIQCA